MFNIVAVALVNGKWVEKVIATAKTLAAGREKADALNGERDDSDTLAMVCYVVKPAKRSA